MKISQSAFVFLYKIQRQRVLYKKYFLQSFSKNFKTEPWNSQKSKKDLSKPCNAYKSSSCRVYAAKEKLWLMASKSSKMEIMENQRQLKRENDKSLEWLKF